jgi:hypothetical protein
MKRSLDEEDQPVDAAPLLSYVNSTPLLAHMLSYAWKHTFTLSLVCKRFYEIIKTDRSYWRSVALLEFKHVIPKEILLEVDFFFGLRSTDVPYAWLWCVFDEENYHITDRMIGLQYFADRQLKTRRVLEIFNFPKTAKNCYSQSLTVKAFDGLVTWRIEDDTEFRERYFNHPKYITTMGRLIPQDNELRETIQYVEMYSVNHQRIWCGTLCDKDGFVNCSNPPFGVWIDAAQYKQNPFYV